MRNKKSKWDEQDAAFFGWGSSGSGSSSASSGTGANHSIRNRNRNPERHNSSDEELARRLQQQLLDEQAKADKVALDRDMEFARRLQNAGSDVSSINENADGTTRGGNGSGSGRNRVSASASARGAAIRGDQRKRQEDEDAALARALMEEEERNRNQHLANNAQGRDISDYPGMRRNRGQGQGQGQGQRRAPTTRQRVPNARRRQNSGIMGGLIPTCIVCNEIALMPISALGAYYHPECFKCFACHGVIDPNQPFAYTKSQDDPDGRSYPMHRHCHSELYGIRCTVCRNPIKSDDYGRVSYIRHPFFDKEIMCPHHQNDPSVRKCTGCNRYEPIGGGNFVELGDHNRCVCDACLRTVIVDSEDAKPLWNSVLQFFEKGLKLPVWNELRQVPILIVGHDALNDQMRHGHAGHGGWAEQIMTTRGLCLTEHHRGFNFMLPRMRFDRSMSSFLPSDARETGHTYFRIPDASSRSNPNTAVTAILCLSGLPSDLTASILAHEACHAWIKLNPDFHISKPIPPQVEEGCCQLIAMLFLNDGLPPIPNSTSSSNVDGDGGAPTDQKLRQYFKFSIESAADDIYGEGYRLAAKAYAKIGIEALLSHVVNYQEFPSV